MKEVKVKEKKTILHLTCTTENEHFAPNTCEVVNIHEMQTITRVLKSTDYMLVSINLRGEVLPVVDANKKLGIDVTKSISNKCILVID